jgi:hypothetical protein
LARRTAVLGAVTKRCRETSASPTVAGRALSIAFSLQYEWSREDPIEQNSVTFHSSHVTAEEIESLLDQWPDALEVLRTLSPATCKQLNPMVREWAFPGMLVVRSGVSDEVIQATHSGAARMLEDLSTLWQDHPGIVAWAARIAKLADLNVALPAEVDSDFKLLFPEEDRIGGWSKHFQQLHGAARETGTRWSAEEPVAVAARLVRYDAEASLGGHRWPRLVNVAAEGIAEHVTDRIAWIVALVAAESAPDIVAPFLRLAMASDGEAADAIWIRSFETDRYRHLSLAEAIRAPSLSDTVLSQTLTGLGGATELIKTACFRSEVPPRLLEQLLLHSEKAVAEAAAEGLWHSGNEGEIPAELREAWEQAVVQHLDSAHTLEQIFSKHPTLARDWLVAHARRTGEGAWRLSGSINYAVSVLDRDTRRELVVELPCNGHGPGLFKLLVGDDRDLYRSFLERPAPEYIHLEPLEGKPTEAWVCLAEVALEVGYEPEDLVAAAYGHAWSWWGKESSLWQSWADAFAPLEQHDDNRIREIGRIGREEAEHRRDRAIEREQDEAVFGRS